MTNLRRIARAIPGMLRVGFSMAVAYRSEFVIWMLTTNMPLVMMALWMAVAHDAPIGGYGERDFAVYFLGALIVRLLTSSWVLWEINWEIRQGTLAMRLLRPIHPLLSYAVDNIAALPIRIAFTFPIPGVILALIAKGSLSHDPIAWLAMIPGLAGAWVVNFSVMALIGTLGVYVESSLALFDIWLAFYFVLSGYIVPISLLPRSIVLFANWLPFRYLLSFPVEIMTGHLSRREIAIGLIVQWAYVTALIFFARALWRRAVVRFAAFGG